MLVILLVIAGVVFIAALAITAYLYVGNGADNEAAVQRHLVRREQQLAEARIQRAMQDSVEQMFRAVRNDR